MIDATTFTSALDTEMVVKSAINTAEINLSILFIICYKVTECYNITFDIARINIVNKLNSETLIKVDNVGLFKNDKWLVKGVSLEVKRRNRYINWTKWIRKNNYGKNRSWYSQEHRRKSFKIY